MHRLYGYLFGALLAVCPTSASALPGSSPAGSAQVVRSQSETFRVVTLLDGLEHPWSLAFLPDGRWLISERPGRLRLVVDGRLQAAPIRGLPPLRAHGQGGLLDIAVHPQFRRNGWIYLAYAGPGDLGEGTEVARARLRGDRLEDLQVIFRMFPKIDSAVHFGGRLLFDRAGDLFITLGERGEREQAQRLENHFGTVVRLREDGQIPADNPFVGRRGARPEIYSYGHRNVQGAALHPDSGRIWTHEHGPQGGDEVNVLQAGVNYGWPVITYGVNYVTGTRIGEGTHKAGMAQPVYHWTPSIAPSGMAFYTGSRFPGWRGDLLVGALRGSMLVRLRLDGERAVAEERMLEGIGRIRDVRVGADGLVYLLTDEENGRLIRLEPLE